MALFNIIFSKRNFSILSLSAFFFVILPFFAHAQKSPLKVYNVYYRMLPSTADNVGLLYQLKDTSLVVTQRTIYSKRVLKHVQNKTVDLPPEELLEIPFSQLKRLKIRKRGAVRRGFLISSAIGIVGGFTLAHLIHGDLTEEERAIERQFKLGLGISLGVMLTGTLLSTVGVNIPIGHKKGLFLQDREKLSKIAIIRD